MLSGGIMTVSAQTDALSRRVSVSVDGGTLDDAVVQIEKQTSLMFFYKTQDIDPNHRVTLHAQQEPLSTVLDVWSRGRNSVGNSPGITSC